MPLYLDVHRQLPSGATAADVAAAHEADVAIQERFGVIYGSYWVDQGAGQVFCQVETPRKLRSQYIGMRMAFLPMRSLKWFKGNDRQTAGLIWPVARHNGGHALTGFEPDSRGSPRRARANLGQPAW